MRHPTLKHAPLKEVMIELRWKLDPALLGDPGFEMGSGLFWGAIKEEFPVHQRLNVPSAPRPYRVCHQWKKDEDDSPVIQLGPGVITLSHSNKGYSWDDAFMPLFGQVIQTFLQTYPYEGEMKFFLTLLRYMDAVKIGDYGHASPTAFLKEWMNVSVQSEMEGFAAENLQIQQEYAIDSQRVQLSISSGSVEDKTAIIWNTTCGSRGEKTIEEVKAWLPTAHNILWNLFEKLCKQPLRDSFA